MDKMKDQNVEQIIYESDYAYHINLDDDIQDIIEDRKELVKALKSAIMSVVPKEKDIQLGRDAEEVCGLMGFNEARAEMIKGIESLFE